MIILLFHVLAMIQSREKIEWRQVYLEWLADNWSQGLLHWPALGKLKCSLCIATAVPLHFFVYII